MLGAPQPHLAGGAKEATISVTPPHALRFLSAKSKNADTAKLDKLLSVPSAETATSSTPLQAPATPPFA